MASLESFRWAAFIVNCFAHSNDSIESIMVRSFSAFRHVAHYVSHFERFAFHSHGVHGLSATNNNTNSALIFSSNTDLSPNMRNGQKNSTLRITYLIATGLIIQGMNTTAFTPLQKDTHDPRLFPSKGRRSKWRSVSSEIRERHTHCLLLVFRRRYVFVHSHRIMHDRYTHIFEQRCV